MLGTLLDKLESLFSKGFVVSSMPLLAFLFLNCLMAYRVSYHFQKWVGLFFALDATHVAVVSFGLLLIVVILSFVVSTLNVSLREFLEGKHLWEWLANALSQRYRDRLANVEEKLASARHNLRAIRANESDWRNAMGVAYQRWTGGGADVAAGDQYTRRPQLICLLDRRLANQTVAPLEIQAEVDAMTAALTRYSPIAPTSASANLDNDHGALLKLFQYAADKWDAEVIKYFNQIQFDFAGKDVAPTTMGNISEIASYYARSRYSMNLEVFWSRLQKILQGDASFYPVLQQAKMQLDFLVELFYLTLVFTLTWVIVLPILGEAKSTFVVIAVTGPVVTWTWYRIALQNYRALSDLLRAAIDLYRLDLLKTLHAPLPVNAEQERVLWENLEQRAAYGDHTNFALQNP